MNRLARTLLAVALGCLLGAVKGRVASGFVIRNNAFSGHVEGIRF